jgi:hypothetical protein
MLFPEKPERLLADDTHEHKDTIFFPNGEVRESLRQEPAARAFGESASAQERFAQEAAAGLSVPSESKG